MASGIYPVKTEYFQKMSGYGLSVMYERPGEDEPVPVPMEHLCSNLKEQIIIKYFAKNKKSPAG